MQEPATTSWDLSISDADFQKLKAGFEPQDQDDKWHIWHASQNEGDNISIHFARSGTGNELYVLHVTPRDDSSSNDIKVKAITWSQNKGGIRISEEQGKKDVVIIARRVLECEFEALPEYDVSDLWNHPAARTDATK
ncbi:hypothetical protein ACN47E_003131 [Coniothyrium glycines]